MGAQESRQQDHDDPESKRDAERANRFVPEHYGDKARIPHRYKPGAPTIDKLIPRTDFEENVAALSAEQFERVKVRGMALASHAEENEQNEVSESTWEADIRTDLFGLMRGDGRLRM